MAYPYTDSFTLFSTDNLLATGASGAGVSYSGAPVSIPSAGSSGGMSFAGMAGPIMGIIGGIGQAYSAFAQARSTQQNLKFQADMAAINARMAEGTAQSILMQGEKAQGQVSMRAGKVKSAQKVSAAARGVAMDSSNVIEEQATTDLMKETDMLQINANAVRQAWAARTQAVNYQNESLMKGTTADSISPFSAMSSSLIGSAAQIAPQWYALMKDRR